jgi:hypothetical protein
MRGENRSRVSGKRRLGFIALWTRQVLKKERDRRLGRPLCLVTPRALGSLPSVALSSREA